MHRTLLALLLLAVCPPPARAASSPDFAAVIEAALPGIVNITVWREGTVEGAPPSEMGSEHRTPIAGTGFAIDPSGLIVTNRHVIEGASTISVGFSDRSRARATVLAMAASIDVAILKVDLPRPIPALKFGDSERLRIGQPVICVGNPLGIGLTVSSGVVSALNRDIHKTTFDDFIQSDCAINPGNSGGPMMNADGEVVGVDTANIDPYGGGSIGLGFALTSNDVAFVVPRLVAMGRVNAGWLGLAMQDVTPELAKALALPSDRGFIVNDVDAEGPGDRAGLGAGDVILAFDGQVPADTRALMRLIARAEVGADVPVDVFHDGQARRIAMTVMEFPGGPVKIMPPVDERPRELPDLGFKVEPLITPSGPRAHGVVVTDVVDDSIASEAGILVGSVIAMVQERGVGDAADVARAIADARRADRKFVALLVRGKTGQQSWMWLKL